MPVAAVRGHAFEDGLPGGAPEEVVVDDEERADAVVIAGVANPAYHRLGIAGPHRSPHDVLHAAVGAGEGTAARRVERRHVGRREAVEVRVADRRELRAGDHRHGDLSGAGLGTDAVGDAVARPQLAPEIVVEQLAPDRLGLADDRRDAAVLEEHTGLGMAAHVEAAEQHREPGAAELKREVPPARVLVGLHAGEADDDFDPVLERLLLDGADGGGKNRAIHLLVPDDRFEVDALIAAQLVVGVVESRQDRERVVRQHALPEPLHPPRVVVLRRLDEIHAERSADDRIGAERHRSRKGIGHGPELACGARGTAKDDPDKDGDGAAKGGHEHGHGRPPCVARRNDATRVL
ncbi:MAG: hypothetical protein E6J75_16880 [Deltaproteobacteria bacterium]|nr:MAG: hypothetical protein E6J75_16880 [Deltaproteobacteria bacterium]